MQAHGDERLEVVGHRRLLDPQQLLRQRGLEVGGDAQRDLRPAEEQRRVDREVAVVRVIERVEPHPALPRDVLLVDLDRAQVRVERALVVAAQHVDVRRHVHEVAGVGDERAQPVRDRQRLLGERRHLHQVHVEVREPGVRAAAGTRERALEHLLGLERRRTLGRQAREAIPQLPRREVHQRVGEQRRDVELVGMRAVDGTHRVGVVGVPRDEVGRRVVGLVAAPRAPRRAPARPARRGPRTRAPPRPRRTPSRATPRGRPGRTPPTACCSSARSRRRSPSGRARSPDRARPRARSTGSPPRGGTRRTTRARGRTTSGRSSTPSTSHACRCRDRNTVPSLSPIAVACRSPKIAHNTNRIWHSGSDQEPGLRSGAWRSALLQFIAPPRPRWPTRPASSRWPRWRSPGSSSRWRERPPTMASSSPA